MALVCCAGLCLYTGLEGYFYLHLVPGGFFLVVRFHRLLRASSFCASSLAANRERYLWCTKKVSVRIAFPFLLDQVCAVLIFLPAGSLQSLVVHW